MVGFLFLMSNNGKEGHEGFVFHLTLESMATQMQSHALGIDFANLSRRSFFGTHSINNVCNFHRYFVFSLVCHIICEFASQNRKVFFNFFR